MIRTQKKISRLQLRDLTRLIKLIELARAHLYILISMAPHNPSLTCEYELSPLAIIYNMKPYHCNVISTYLSFALIPWAVPLVYEDRSVDVIHDNVLEMQIEGKSRIRIRPCFDSHASHCVCKSATNNSDPRHRLFILVLTKTSYADSMARSTVYSLNKYIPAAVTERDAIITS